MEHIQDPRILAIMAKLDNKPTESEPANEKKKQTAEEKTVKPPQTFEEFLKAEKLNEWPQRITSENLLDLEEERELLGTKEDIYEELRKAVPFNVNMLEDLENQLHGLEAKLKLYASDILTEDKRESRMSDRLFYSPAKAFLTDMSESDAVRSHPSRRGQRKKDFKDEVKEGTKKSVRYCSFPGFRAGELTQFPGQLEGPQLLHRVTKAQDFNPGFRKFWKKIFLSEASVAIVQDGFWWFFLENFEKGRKSEQDQLFDRIADSFVALFNSINPEVKDKFLNVYADCLAQAIYAAFHELFPDSERHFQNDFKQQIINTAAEWIAGIKPPPGGFKNWDIKRLEPKSMRDTETSQTQNMRKMISAANLNNDVSMSLDMDDFNKTVQRLGDKQTAVPVEMGLMVPGLSREVTRGSFTNNQMALVPAQGMSMSRVAQCGTPRREVTESHQVGPGHQLERVMFNTKGQSPLVAHYLHMHHLKDKNQPGPRVKRTEVAKLQPEGKTYKDLIRETKAASDTLSREYQRICDITNQEILLLEKQKRDMNRRMEKLKRELMFSKNSTEIRILSQRILEGREKEGSGLPSKEARPTLPDGESDEDDI